MTQNFPGSSGNSCQTPNSERVSRRLLSSSSFSQEISNSPNRQSSTRYRRPHSHIRSGRTLSPDLWSTSTTSSRGVSLLPTTTEKSSDWAEWKSSSESPNPSSRSRRRGTGSLPGGTTQRRQCMYPHTDEKNLTATEHESYPYSLRPHPVPTLPLSTWTKVSEPVSGMPQPSPHRSNSLRRTQIILA